MEQVYCFLHFFVWGWLFLKDLEMVKIDMSWALFVITRVGVLIVVKGRCIARCDVINLI